MDIIAVKVVFMVRRVPSLRSGGQKGGWWVIRWRLVEVIRRLIVNKLVVFGGLLEWHNCFLDGFYGSIRIASRQSRLAMTVWVESGICLYSIDNVLFR